MRPPLSTLSAWGVSPLAGTAPCLAPDTPAIHSPRVLPCPSPLQPASCFLSLHGWWNRLLLVFSKPAPASRLLQCPRSVSPDAPCAQVLRLALWAAVLPGGGLGSPSFHADQSPPRAQHSVCPENIYSFLWRLWTWARKVSLKDSVDSVQPIPELRPRTPRGALGPKSEAVESLFGCDCNQPDGMLTSGMRMAVKGEGSY